MKRAFVFFAAVVLSLPALAQRNEASVTFGGMFSLGAKGTSSCEAILICPTNVDVVLSPSFALNGSFAHRIADFKAAALFVEFPLLANPSRSGG